MSCSGPRCKSISKTSMWSPPSSFTARSRVYPSRGPAYRCRMAFRPFCSKDLLRLRFHGIARNVSAGSTRTFLRTSSGRSRNAGCSSTTFLTVSQSRTFFSFTSLLRPFLFSFPFFSSSSEQLRRRPLGHIGALIPIPRHHAVQPLHQQTQRNDGARALVLLDDDASLRDPHDFHLSSGQGKIDLVQILDVFTFLPGT